MNSTNHARNWQHKRNKSLPLTSSSRTSRQAKDVKSDSKLINQRSGFENESFDDGPLMKPPHTSTLCQSTAPSVDSPMMSSSFAKGKSNISASKNSSGLFCRICHEGDSEELISPCSCSGSVGLIHRTCIEKWLSMVNKDSCEICKEKYQVSKQSKPFITWLLTPSIGDDQRNLIGDAVCFILLTPLTCVSAYLCASGAIFYLKVKKSEAIGLLCLASLLIAIYFIWLLLTIKYHFQVWFKWRLNNQDIRLLDVSSNRPVPAKRKMLNTSNLVTFNETETSKTEIISSESDSPTEPHSSLENVHVTDDEKIEVFNEKDASASNDVSEDISPSHTVNVSKSQEHTACINELKNLSNVPLSPNIISINSIIGNSTTPGAGNSGHQLVYSTPLDNDLYATVPRSYDQALLSQTPIVPYVSELKERCAHIMVIGSAKEDKKSRGSFSPKR